MPIIEPNTNLTIITARTTSQRTMRPPEPTTPTTAPPVDHLSFTPPSSARAGAPANPFSFMDVGAWETLSHSPRKERLTLPEVMARENIPEHLHWVWFGKALPEVHLDNIIEHAESMPGAKKTLWSDVPRSIFRALGSRGTETVQQRLASVGIEIRDPKELLEAARSRNISSTVLESALARETHGTFRNYAAASDITRLLALHEHGGVYFDTDVESWKGLPPIEVPVVDGDAAPREALYLPLSQMHFSGYLHEIANSILAAPAKSGLIEAMLGEIAEAYKKNSSAMWIDKRFSPDEKSMAGQWDEAGGRLGVTLQTTGPAMMRRVIYAKSTAENWPESRVRRMSQAMPSVLITPQRPDASASAWRTMPPISYDAELFENGRLESRELS